MSPQHQFGLPTSNTTWCQGQKEVAGVVTLRNACLVDTLEPQEGSRGALLAFVCDPCPALPRAWSCLRGGAAPGQMMLPGTARRKFWDGGLIPWHSAVFPVYLVAAGQNTLSESCGCFGGGIPGHLHMGLIKSSSTWRSYRHLCLPCSMVLGGEELELCW